MSERESQLDRYNANLKIEREREAQLRQDHATAQQNRLIQETRARFEAQRLHSYWNEQTTTPIEGRTMSNTGFWNENGDAMAIPAEEPQMPTIVANTPEEIEALSNQYDEYVETKQQWDTVWSNPKGGSLDLLYDPNI